MASHPPSIFWMGSVSLCCSIHHEQRGCVQGPTVRAQAAQAYNMSGLDVVGDSNLMLGQMWRWTAPKAPHLQDLYR
uniref:Uncharacterized protein n=1 Tax=Hyaloperonospora arabidopsidis (strain Emoy2) TaxID=559515 RepID=M4BAU2_HYAAE